MIKVALDKQRTVHFSNYAIMELEDKLDVSIFDLLKEFGDMEAKGTFPKMKVIYTILWAGMIEKEDVTFKEVSQMVDLQDISKILPKVMQELAKALGADEPQEKGSKKK